MDRRTLLLGAAPLLGLALTGCSKAQKAAAPAAQAGPPVTTLTPAQAARLGMTTVCFRHNFDPPIGAAAASGPKLKMLEAPKFMKDTFGLSNVEVWNMQFEDQSIDYCHKLRAAAEAIGSKIINIQLDGDYDLSSDDPKRRADSIALVKGWMDRAAAVGAPTMRANIDAGKAGLPLKLEPTATSFRQLADYGKTIGVKILIENHIGASAKVSNVVQLLKAVNHPNCRAIIDWGNSDAPDDAARLADLSQLFPWAELVSAKGLHFDGAEYKHRDYAIAPIVRATEASGYKGIYSVELYAEPDAPADAVAACRSMIAAIAPELKA